MKYPRLGVNIDHVATLRQQRGEFYPEVFRAASLSLDAGAEQITIHLREDRRHIQDHDVPEVHQVCRQNKKLLNLEMGMTEEMLEIATKEKPDWICLVPEKRQERTTEGGLDVGPSQIERVREFCDSLKKNLPDTKISLFVEGTPEVMKQCLTTNSDAVEIHTGQFAMDFLAKKDLTHHLEMYQKSWELIHKSGRGFHAGHGLTHESVLPLLEQGLFEEYNIGHWIISEAVFLGLGEVVKQLKTLMDKHPLKGIV